MTPEPPRMPEEGQPSAEEEPSVLQTLAKLVVGFLVVFGLAALLGVWFREPLEALGTHAVERYGLLGLAGIVLLVDLIPSPLSYVPFMFLASAGGLSFAAVFFVSASASYSAGLIGYGLGRAIGMPPRLDRWMTEKHPRVRQLLDRKGGWGVAAISALPVPVALGTWSAGAVRVPLSQVALALVIRWPKTAAYLVMIHSGLSLGAG